MHVKLLIDGIVRQTTVLIAQLSTASGVRAPLSHVADQVFLELSREIEAQGVKRQVVADMFGMALRSYQKKVQRLMESQTVRDRTLWEAVFELVEQEGPSRDRVLERFRNDGEKEVASVLRDLVRSGLVYVTGSGPGAVYGATSEHVQRTIRERQDADSLLNLLWLAVFRGSVTSAKAVAAHFGVSEQAAARAVAELLASGRVEESDGELKTRTLTVPFGAEQGFEAAVLDHFQTVARAIARKVKSGANPSNERDDTGGSTFTFALTPSHPLRDEVEVLFGEVRTRVQALWDRVAAHNRLNPPSPDERFRVSFYVGQTHEDEGEDE
jgi:hypothetical protein